MDWQENDIHGLVKEVLKKLEGLGLRPEGTDGANAPPAGPSGVNLCVYTSVDAAVSAAAIAQRMVEKN